MLYPSPLFYTLWCEDLPPSRSLAERGQPRRNATCHHPPPCGWGCRTVKGYSTAPHPSPLRLPLFRGRWHVQASWGHAGAPLPPPTRLPLHRSSRQAVQGGWNPATAYPATCRTHVLQCGPLLGQHCPRRDKHLQFFYFTERGILSPVRAVCRQRAPGPRRNTECHWLPRNFAILLPPGSTDRHCRATCPSRHRRRRRRPVLTGIDDVCTVAPSSAAPRVHTPTRARSPTSPPKTAVPEHFMHEPTQPEHFPGSSPNPSPPPAKRTRKAARRRCEAELLRDGGEEGDILLSPLTRPFPALTPQPPTPPPAPTPTPRSALPVLTSSQGPPTPACSSPEQPSPIAALVIPFTPPTPCVSPPTPLPATGPPTPPKWPEAYIFSTDPDRIVCRKCCKRHYNFRWYSHCFMCN
jgi:hypothetical protein